MPLLIGIICWLIYAVRVNLVSLNKEDEVFGQHMHFTMIFIFCVVPPMTRLLATGLVCDSETIPGISFLVASPAVDCDSDMYNAFLPFAIIMFLAYFSTPLLCLGILFAKHGNHRNCPRARARAHSRSSPLFALVLALTFVLAHSRSYRYERRSFA